MKKMNQVGGLILGAEIFPDVEANVLLDYTDDVNMERTGEKGQAAIRDAIKDYHTYTCLRFVPRTNQNAYIFFWRGPGCDSPVGYRSYGNHISLGRNCWKKGVVMHEIAHSLGMFHEHSRPDRGNYVKIIWENIQGDEKVNFQKKSKNDIDSLNTPYDLESMMHYPGNAFGGGKTTIQVLDTSKQSWIGQREGFSEIDKKQVNLMYKCGDINPPTPSQSPKVTSTRSTTKLVTSQPQCHHDEDLDTKCSYWASRDFCTSKNQQTLAIMRRKCCKSCKGKGRVCKDDYSDCGYWASTAQCTKAISKDFMARSCRKSCNLC